MLSRSVGGPARRVWRWIGRAPAALGGNEVLLVANGAGWKRAAAAVDAAAPRLFARRRGQHGILRRAGRAAGDRRCGGGDRWSSGRGVTCATCQDSRAAEGRHLGLHRPRGSNGRGEARACALPERIAVEMEAAGVAQRARALGLPFYCVRAVTDLAGENMANDFNAALRSDGHFDTIRIFKGTLRHPTVRLPELIRLRNRCVRAARALGEFFADCRF